MMAYYQCAIMEVETKFKVLSEQHSLEYDLNRTYANENVAFSPYLTRLRREILRETEEKIARGE